MVWRSGDEGVESESLRRIKGRRKKQTQKKQRRRRDEGEEKQSRGRGESIITAIRGP